LRHVAFAWAEERGRSVVLEAKPAPIELGIQNFVVQATAEVQKEAGARLRGEEELG
jgi:hypothetical protein